jgi:hypothetical protein
MNDEYLKDYAEYLIREHVQDIPHLSIYEMEDSFRLQFGGAFEDEGGEISDAEVDRVQELLGTAQLKITWC